MKRLICIGCLLMSTVISAQDQRSRAWQKDLDYLVQRIEIMHPNPYAQLSEEAFNQAKENLHNLAPQLSDTDIVLSISELLASLKDGHTRWAFERSNPQWLQQIFHLLPVIQYAFKDGIYIMAGLSQHSVLVGLKVTKIGNMPIADVIQKLGHMWSHDNPSGEKKFLYYTLNMAEILKKAGAAEDVSEIEMVLQNNQGEEISVRLPTVDFFSMAPFFVASWYPQAGNGLAAMNQRAQNPLPLWLRNPGEKFWFEYLREGKIMFLQINSLNFPHGNGKERSQFGKLCDQFFETFDQSGAEKLVIDIRTNTGGNHVELPLLEGIMARPHLNKEDRLFLITGRVTFSAAVHLTTILKRNTDITIIGEPPSGRPNHYGANRTFSLPNHPQIKINCSIDYYQDSQPFDFNIMHAPDIYAAMTAADYQHNIDPAMQAVKNYDQITDKVGRLSKELKQAYTDSGVHGIKKVYSSNKQTFVETGYNREKFFKEFFYGYLAEKKINVTDLLDFLAFILKECPKSIDLNYLLASQLEAAGHLEKAQQHYSRCIELNPEHHYAKMKLGLMRLEE